MPDIPLRFQKKFAGRISPPFRHLVVRLSLVAAPLERNAVLFPSTSNSVVAYLSLNVADVTFRQLCPMFAKLTSQNVILFHTGEQGK